MEKAIRVLDDAAKSLKSEIRIWAKQGDMDIVEKCRDELKQCEDAIKILSKEKTDSDTESKCNKHIITVRCFLTELEKETNKMLAKQDKIK